MLGFSAQANAFIRHIYSFVGGAGFVFALLGLDQATRDQVVAAVHQIGDGFSSILAGVGVLVPIGAGLWARYTAKPAQQIAAVEAQGHTVIPAGQGPSSTAQVGGVPRSSLAVLVGPLALLLMLAPTLGACMWTDSQGNQVVLTAQNATPLVIDKIKQVCAAYDANKVTYDALTSVATAAIQNAQLSNAAMTAQQIATAACPLIEALIKTETVPPAVLPPAAAPTAGSG